MARSGTGSAADSVATDSVETGSVADSVAAGSVFETDLVFVTALGSASFLDSVLVSIRSFSADVGVVALVSVGIHGGGDTRTIHTRIMEVMAGTGTMTPGRTAQT
jgi:hypothetical protein